MIPFREWFGGNIGLGLGVIGIEFIIGLILGLLVKKALKIIVLGAIIIALGSYLGILAVHWDKLSQYSGTAVGLLALLPSILPFGVGLIIGVIIGFIKG